MQYFFKKFLKKSFTKILDKIQKVWYNNAAWCIKETTQTNVCLLKPTTLPGVSRLTLDIRFTLLGVRFTVRFTLF